MCKFSTFCCGFYQYSSAAFIRERLICNVLSLKTRDSSLAQCDMYSERATGLCQCHTHGKIVLKCKQTFWCAKVVNFSRAWTILGCHFQAAVRLLCNLSLEKKSGFMFKCGFYTRLYVCCFLCCHRRGQNENNATNTNDGTGVLECFYHTTVM